ncbi:MAG: hypothetical protein JOY86_02025 [Candidatus Eremiobacteraeota bacterium]|nr:hypothetical protein [Candidatus Eremiobacteraeota bacterium]MBV8365712.1 hypothetical protein [Candidatus Eremiobacteraeota bacterium]
MNTKNYQAIARPLVAAALALIVALSMARPVRADGAASTRNIILGAAAAIAGIVIYENVHNKNVAHNTVVGYTPDGGTVYADGRVVYPNGQVLYTGTNGAPCSWDGSEQYCGANPTVYYPNNNYPQPGYGYSNYPAYQPAYTYPTYNYPTYTPPTYSYPSYMYSTTRTVRDTDDRYNASARYNVHNNGRNGNQWNGNRGNGNANGPGHNGDNGRHDGDDR